jgi:hypothetical protein
MQVAGGSSWRIAIDEWNESLALPLWIRAAERINVPPGGVVPGPLDVDLLPEASATDRSALVEGWHTWWYAVVGGPSTAGVYDPPDFAELDRWPALAAVVRARSGEAYRWHRRRKRRGTSELRPSSTNIQVVAGVEREIGHRAAPFELEFVLLPVLDEEIRRVRDLRFLVPERVYLSARWPDWLRGLVRSVA